MFFYFKFNLTLFYLTLIDLSFQKLPQKVLVVLKVHCVFITKIKDVYTTLEKAEIDQKKLIRYKWNHKREVCINQKSKKCNKKY